MKGYKRSIAFLFVCAMSVFSRSEDTLSTQEIFRPLILPRGMWQLYADRNMSFSAGGYPDRPTHFSIFHSSFIPAHSFSDRFMMNAFPFPSFVFRISKYDILDKNKKWTKRPSITVNFGISNVLLEHMEFPVNLQIRLKKLISEKTYYYLILGAGSWFRASQPINFSGGIRNGLGIQLSLKTCLTIAYSFFAIDRYVDPFPLYLGHSIPIGLRVNINKNISVNIRSGVDLSQDINNDKLYINLPVIAGFTCQW